MIEYSKVKIHHSLILSFTHPIIHSFSPSTNIFQSNNMILVFKTDVSSGTKARKLKPHLDENLADARWNFDLSDCDKILRVDSPEDISIHVISLLNRHGFSCAELE